MPSRAPTPLSSTPPPRRERRFEPPRAPRRVRRLRSSRAETPPCSAQTRTGAAEAAEAAAGGFAPGPGEERVHPRPPRGPHHREGFRDASLARPRRTRAPRRASPFSRESRRTERRGARRPRRLRRRRIVPRARMRTPATPRALVPPWRVAPPRRPRGDARRGRRRSSSRRVRRPRLVLLRHPSSPWTRET